MMPPVLRPIENDPKGAPDRARRCGRAHQHVARGHDHAGEKSGDAHRHDQHRRWQTDRADQQDDDRVDREAVGRDLAVPARPVGDEAAAQHAKGTRRQVGAQRQVRRRERQTVGARQRGDRKIGDAAARQAEQSEEDGQCEQRRGEDRALASAFWASATAGRSCRRPAIQVADPENW